MHLSPLNDFHVSHGAKMVEFAGWSMPVFYRGIVEEHLHTRAQVSVFDVSHMGRLRIAGGDVEGFLQGICTRQLAGTAVGQSRYSHVCNERGGIIDDVIVGRHADHWLMVCNASNREAMVQWLNRHAAGRGIEITDQTFETAMVAIQGPAAVRFVEETFSIPVSHLKRYGFVDGTFMGMDYSIARSGYTGEDGVEAIVPVMAVELVMPMLCGGAGDTGGESSGGGVCKPAGLGARDSLRLEAAMPLYGHELGLEVDSLSAGQGWCVDLEKSFIGVEALRGIRAGGLKRRMTGFELDGRRIARQGYAVLRDGERVGEITSGTMSPTLQKSIAMGYLEASLAEPGTRVTVDLGRKENPATVVPLPFYKRDQGNKGPKDQGKT